MAFNTAILTTSATISDAEFQAIIQFIANTLEAGGVTKTADTGQIDPLTAVFPAVNNTSGGYEIREFTDALAGTDPVVLRINYMRGANAAGFSIGITLGTGSDGAGTITGVELVFTQFNIILSLISTRAWISAGTNRFAISMPSQAGQSSHFGLERTLNSSGVATNAGLQLTHRLNNSFSQQFINYQGVNPAVDLGMGGMPPRDQTTGLHANGNVAIYPNFFFGVGETLVPGKNFVGGFVNDFTPENTYTVSLLGTDHIFVFLPTNPSNTIARGQVPNGNIFGVMMRYE